MAFVSRETFFKFIFLFFIKLPVKIALFSDVMPYGLVVCYQYLGGMYGPLFSGWKNYDNRE